MTSEEREASAPERATVSGRVAARLPRAAAVFVAGVATTMLVVLTAAAFQGRAYRSCSVRGAAGLGADRSAPERAAVARIAALAPRGGSVVVDTAGNTLRVYRKGELLREATCSTGTGTVLRDPRSDRSWVFDTPLGERRVVGKRRDPVWTKPEWAFVEEGFLPPSDLRHLVDTVSLGDYAIDLGDGYLIHGTLFPSLLGQSITHGCIRLGDEDLEYVYRTVPVGAPVYLY
jgi:hypothetical protein